MAHDILIVEDERNIALSLEFLMKQAGHSVRSVGDGQDALDAVAEQLPDLILLDVNLPSLDGYTVCSTLRANEKTCGVLVLMLTARGREIEREKGMAAGANDYLTKPFSTRELVQRVESLLGDA
ncbi:response regulator transcription factor [Granulosicoccus sp. 3-233]|uniref:response regulator transcription factor n=1 Tax=Granulosicoccus sp. 3-233 TaxID=3417969 RepID=UPI003D354A40